MAKKEGYSREGLFGTVYHYDAKGHKVGESRPGFFGGYNNYDAKGHKVGESRPSFFGGYTNYDAKGHKTGSVSPSFFGGQTHYDAQGHRIGTSNPTLLGGQTHSGSFGGGTGFINNAGSAAGVHREEQTILTAAAAAGAAQVAKPSVASLHSVEPKQPVENAPTIAAESTSQADIPDVKTVRYVIASVPSKQTNVYYRTEESDISIGEWVLDLESEELVRALAVVECLEEALPPEAVGAEYVVQC